MFTDRPASRLKLPVVLEKVNGALTLMSLVACSVRVPPASEFNSDSSVPAAIDCVVVPNWAKVRLVAGNPPVVMSIFLGSSKIDPPTPRGASTRTRPSKPRFSLPETSTCPPLPPNAPPRASICPEYAVLRSDQTTAVPAFALPTPLTLMLLAESTTVFWLLATRASRPCQPPPTNTVPPPPVPLASTVAD